jgi:hypothetical protein
MWNRKRVDDSAEFECCSVVSPFTGFLVPMERLRKKTARDKRLTTAYFKHLLRGAHRRHDPPYSLPEFEHRRLGDGLVAAVRVRANQRPRRDAGDVCRVYGRCTFADLRIAALVGRVGILTAGAARKLRQCQKGHRLICI